eukprot:TRINITY_DN15980_c0_g1_i1.p1 TRINITY_DN15980_c0_g1~~TRINITY_DN15980_c0_g1_i1.p1  ORF type:complete len:133 (+),score=31.02 TRINITY_DN15980_c0_g1_i1:236-634(+)
MNDFGHDGGDAAKALSPKLDVFRSHVHNLLQVDIPPVEIKYVLMASIALEGLGGILFTLGSNLGAYCLMIFLAASTPILHDFYNYDSESVQFEHGFVEFLKNLALFGALMVFLGQRSSAAKLAARKRKSKTA